MIIEEYRDADRHKVQEFMREIFSSEKMRKAAYFNSEFWRWQYQGSPYGNAITIVAKDNDDIAGHYANIPVNIKLAGTNIISSVTIDLMVKKAYRRQGLFRKMAETANDKLSEADVVLSFAFPSRAESYAGFVERLGWFKVGDLKILVKPVLQRLFKKRRVRDEINVERIDSFSYDIDTLWGRLRPLVRIGIVRNRDYLNWRYFKNPAGGYEVYMAWRNNMPAGYCVLKTMRFCGVKTGVIVDLFCIDALDIVRTLLQKAEQFFLRSGAFVCIVLKNKLYGGFLEESGFKVLPDMLCPRSYTLIARANTDGLDLAGLKDADNWFLNFGDWDVI